MWRTNPVAFVYNPLNQTEEELLRNFVVREKEFHRVFDDIKKSKMRHPEPHYIIQGQRGQGKTTLLLKIYYEIKRDEKLSGFIQPVIFNEEQYHINSLFGLWSHAAEKLEEENESFAGLYDAIEDLYDEEDAEVEAFNHLEKALKKEKKKMILLIDNVGQLFDKLTRKELQRLREVFITSAEVRLIGASSGMLEHTHDYSKPFYEMFHFIHLDGLTRPETEHLMLKLGEHYKQEGIQRIIKEEPGRLETLRRLTGGVPRTMVLLFEIFVDHEKGNAFADLEFILDRVTPLYKHRMDDLPAQQQKIVDAIALNWDAMPAKEIAQKTRMASKAISSQLKILEKKKIIHSIPTTTKNHFYQVTERFFNIWYLMRYGRRKGMQRVRWLVQFLESWCSPPELDDRTEKHINALKEGTLSTRFAFFFTEALAQTKIPLELQHDLITQTRDFLKAKGQELMNGLLQSDIEICNDAVDLVGYGNYVKAINKIGEVQKKNSLKYYSFFTTLHLYLRRTGQLHSTETWALALEASQIDKDPNFLNLLAISLLRENEVEESLKIIKKIFKHQNYFKGNMTLLKIYFDVLFIKKQYYAALKLFEENQFQLKERLKPFFYALMYFLKDDYPNEYKKMGGELSETVEDYIAWIKKNEMKDS